jgi:hypothetical protein
MRTKLSVAIALAGTLLATCLVSGSAKATSVPVLKVEGSSSIVTLVGRGGRGGGGRHYGGGGRHYGGGGGHRNYGYRGGGRDYGHRNYGHRNYGHRNYGYGHRNYGYRGYRGGRWYGGRWWGYGVGTCWRLTPAGYVWICGY